jgi:hypothetical protein
MSKLTQISRGRAEQVEVQLVQAGHRRRWVTVFCLCGRQMFFVNNVDVNLSARNQPNIFRDGDEVIVLGQEPHFPFVVPRERPSDGYYKVQFGSVTRTGKMFGSNGVSATLLGVLALAVAFGLLAGAISYGRAIILTNFHLLPFISLLLFGGCSLVKGLHDRANWNAISSS